MPGASAGKQYELIWLAEYEAVRDACQNDHDAERAITGLEDAISRGPEFFDEIPEFPGKRLAKSDAKALPGRIVRIWFEIKNEHQVYLCYLEVMPRG